MPMNVTGTGISAVGGADIWFIALYITLIIAGVFLLMFSRYSQYKKLRGFLAVMGKCLGYFAEGLIGLAIFGSLYGGLLMLGSLVQSGTLNLAEILWWIGVALAGFFGIAGLGYLLDRFLFRRIAEYNKRYKKARK